MRPMSLLAACVACCGLVSPVAGQGASKDAAPKVIVGDNPSLSGAPLYLALEKGYYRAAGIDVQLEMSGTTSDMAVLLATNRLQIIGGALSAGFFNSLSKGLPIALMMSRATSPYSHYLMIRPELEGSSGGRPISRGAPSPSPPAARSSSTNSPRSWRPAASPSPTSS